MVVNCALGKYCRSNRTYSVRHRVEDGKHLSHMVNTECGIQDLALKTMLIAYGMSDALKRGPERPIGQKLTSGCKKSASQRSVVNPDASLNS